VDPKLTSGCVRHFNGMLMNITEWPYDLMTMYGTMQLNDLGNYRACRKMPEADYSIVTLNISHIPMTIFLGACLPA
jgi:hypothetical protein